VVEAEEEDDDGLLSPLSPEPETEADGRALEYSR
jgi:hypothetical protein